MFTEIALWAVFSPTELRAHDFEVTHRKLPGIRNTGSGMVVIIRGDRIIQKRDKLDSTRGSCAHVLIVEKE